MLRMMGQIWKHWLFHQLYSMRIIFNDHIFCVFTEWTKKISTILNSSHAETRSCSQFHHPKTSISGWMLDFFPIFSMTYGETNWGFPPSWQRWQVLTTCTTSGVPRGPQLLRRRWTFSGRFLWWFLWWLARDILMVNPLVYWNQHGKTQFFFFLIGTHQCKSS